MNWTGRNCRGYFYLACAIIDYDTIIDIFYASIFDCQQIASVHLIENVLISQNLIFVILFRYEIHSNN